MLTAWGDESGSSVQRDPGIYVLGAIVIDDAFLDSARDAARTLRSPSEAKAHWYGRKSDKRDHAAKILASLPVNALVVVRMAEDSERTERRRRKCLEYLLPVLAVGGCGSVTLESRGKNDDERDRVMMAALQSQGRLATGLRINHEKGPNEAMLWLADALCGAVVADRLGEPRWWNVISRVATIHTIDARS